MSELNSATTQLGPILSQMADLIDSTQQPPIEISATVFLHPGLEMSTDAAALRRSALQLRSGLFNIVVVGRFKNGKSTLVNALLGARAAPTGVTPTTAVISRLIQGEALRITVHRRFGTPYEIDWDTFRDQYSIDGFEDATGGDETALRQQFADIDYVELSYPFPLLMDGVAIIDSPGLGENRLRTSLVLEYLPRAGAIIIVIDAKMSFTQEEQLFMSLLGIGKLQHVFFVINQFDHIAESERERVFQRVQRILTPYFSDEHGVFDRALFEQRVFYTNARGAERAFHDDSFDTQAYDESGVGALRAGLIAHLQGDLRREANLRSLIPALADVLVRARQTGELRIEALSQPLPVVQERLQTVNDRLARMKSTAESLQARIARVGEVVQYQVYADLVQYVTEMQRSWENDVKRLDLSQLANTNFLTGQFSERDKAELSRVLSEQLEQYLQLKLTEWAKRLPKLLQPNLERLLADVHYDLNAIQLELDDLAGVVGQTTVTFKDGSPGLGSDVLLQNVITDDMMRRFIPSLVESTFTDIVRDPRFQDIAMTVLRTVLMTLSLILGGAGKVLYSILARVSSDLLDAQLRDRERERWKSPANQNLDQAFAPMGDAKVHKLQAEIREVITTQLEAPLFERLREMLNTRRGVIFESIGGEFTHMGSEVEASLNKRIEELRAVQARLLEYRSSREFDLQAERDRIRLILSTLDAHFAFLSERALGYRLTDEQMIELVRRRAEFAERTAETAPSIVLPEVPDVQIPVSPPTLDERQTVNAVSNRLMSAIATMFQLRDLDPPPEATVTGLSERLDKLIGLDEVKQRILGLVDYQVDLMQRKAQGMKVGEPPSLHLVFTGNPGTGKTTVAEIIGEIYFKIGLLKSGHVVKTKRAELIGEFIGHTEKRVLVAIERALDGVLFIDEAHQLANVNYVNSSDYGMLAIRTLLEQMEPLRDRLVVIVAGYSKPMEDFLNADPGLRRRFPPDNVIHFPDYKPDELRRILELILNERDFKLDPEAETVAMQVIQGLYERRDDQFGNAGEMRNFADSLILRRATRLRGQRLPVDEAIRTEDINDYYLKFRITKPTVRDTDAVLMQIDAMIGLEGVKTAIREFTAYARRSQRLGERLSAGSMHMIFRGSPGTGKTTVAQHFAEVLHALGYLPTPKLTVKKRSDFLGSHIGQTEEKTARILKEALDGVLLIDEAYSLYIEQAENDFGRVVIHQLNDFMEMHRDRLVVILAGYRQDMDLMLNANAGLRSRFTMVIDFADYTNAELMQIARKMAADDGYTLTPEVETRVAYYLDRLRVQNEQHFGNARDVRELLNQMKKKQALRVDREGITDEAIYRQRAYSFEVPDVPSPPEIISKTVIITMSDRRRGSDAPLRIPLQPAAADRSR